MSLQTRLASLITAIGADIKALQSIGTTSYIDGGATPTTAQDGIMGVTTGVVTQLLVDAKGDIFVASANDTVTRLPIGTAGQTAIVDLAEATGLKYVAICEPYIFTQSGSAVVDTNRKSQIKLRHAYAVETIDAYSKVAPTGASIIVDVNKNGTTLYTTQGNRPTIAIGSNASTTTLPDVLTFAANDILSVDVDQVGSTIAGGDNLTVVIRLRRI